MFSAGSSDALGRLVRGHFGRKKPSGKCRETGQTFSFPKVREEQDSRKIRFVRKWVGADADLNVDWWAPGEKRRGAR